MAVRADLVNVQEKLNKAFLVVPYLNRLEWLKKHLRTYLLRVPKTDRMSNSCFVTMTLKAAGNGRCLVIGLC